MVLKVEVMLDDAKDGIISRQVAYLPEANIAYYIEQAKFLADYTTIQVGITAVGIFNKKKDWQDKVLPGDRIEIYRELVIDIKEKRNERVKRERHA